jgi:hypothetical protein
MSTGFPSDPQFAPNTYQQPNSLAKPRSSRNRWLLGLLLVFLGFFIFGSIVVVGGVYYVATNLDRWLVGLGREALVAMINESEIPVEEKTEVIAQVDRVVTAYKERKINQADLEKALNELNEAPALKVLSLYGLDEVFLTSSGLSEEEITTGRRSYERVLRGVYEGKFTEEELYAVLPLDAEDQANPAQDANAENAGDNIRLVNNSDSKTATDDDIRESLVKLKVMADNASIPSEPFQLDIGDEVKKLVDRLLAGKE